MGVEGCRPTTSKAELTVTALGATYYADADCPTGGCGAALRLMEESNGMPGLQRQDEAVDDTCLGEISPDTYVL
jgi:hypothetical protein